MSRRRRSERNSPPRRLVGNETRRASGPARSGSSRTRREGTMALWSKQEPSPATREAGPIPAPFTPAIPQHNKESFPMPVMTREEVPTTPLGSGSDLLLGAGAEFEG